MNEYLPYKAMFDYRIPSSVQFRLQIAPTHHFIFKDWRPRTRYSMHGKYYYGSFRLIPIQYNGGYHDTGSKYTWTDTCLHANMMTSSNGNIFLVTGLLCGEFTGPDEFPAQKPVTRSFDVFLDLRQINDWVNNREAGDLRRHRGHFDVNVMKTKIRQWRIGVVVV